MAVRIHPPAERSLREGHPWVFASSIREVSREGTTGEPAVLFDRKGRFLGAGLWDPEGPIRVRLLTEGRPERVGTELFQDRIRRALALRDPLLKSSETTGLRLIHGESDGLPGVVVDRYGEHLVLKLYSTSWIPWLEPLGSALSEALPTRGILVRASRGVERSPLTPDPFRHPTVLQGEVPEALPFLEEGMRFEAHPWVGHKTGFYLDQRENRSLLRKQMTAGAKVLNVFSYTGGFSLAAAMGGALEVTSLDQSGPALAQAERHFQLNRHHAKVGSANHRIMEGDAFEALETLARRGERFDGIIVDPPSFAKDREGSEGGLRQYARLTRLALRVLRPGGLLLQASCSSRIGEEAFYRELLRAGESAGRPLREILRTAHPLDHPIRWPESAYLKALLARVP